MIERLFPRVVDQKYTGHPLALWILWPLALFKALMGFNCAGLNPLISNRHIMEGVDRVPLSSFPPEAANAALFSFAAWGLGLLILSLFTIVVLLRWRALVPLAYLMLIAEQFGRKAISLSQPMERAATTAAEGISTAALINWTLSGLLLVGFVLALWAWRPARRRSSW